MKSLNYLIFIIILATGILWSGCTKKEGKLNTPLEQAKTLPTNTPLEKEVKKLYDAYGVTFNYKWDRNAFARNVIADPPSIHDILPYMEVFNVLFFESIKKVGGEDFVREESPLSIFLLGSGINYGGKSNFGEGSAGQAGNIQPNRLTLGGLNRFGQIIRAAPGATSDTAFVKYIYDNHVGTYPPEAGEVGFIYHEWTHYIDAKHDIPKNFQKPAFNNYLRGTNAYRNVSNQNARTQGFMLPYGMQNEAEDFATYVQMMVWQPKNTIKKRFLTSSAAKEKYKMVDDYFKKLGLNLSRLRDTLHSKAIRKQLLEIKHKYDGTARNTQ